MNMEYIILITSFQVFGLNTDFRAMKNHAQQLILSD